MMAPGPQPPSAGPFTASPLRRSRVVTRPAALVILDGFSPAGDNRSVPDGHAPVDLATGEVVATTHQPDWIGVSGSAWTAHVTPTGAIAVARR